MANKAKALEDEALSVRQVAKILNLHPYTVAKLLRRKDSGLQGFKVNHTWRVLRTELNKFTSRKVMA